MSVDGAVPLRQRSRTYSRPEGGFRAHQITSIVPSNSKWRRDVARALESAEHLVIEAGTGVGKSLAYLIPAALYAVRTRSKAVISTHTIALQEQLIYKDIPLVQKLLPIEFEAALLKGRHNFLCGTRLERALAQAGDLFTSGQRAELERIREWSTHDQERLAERFRGPAGARGLGRGEKRTACLHSEDMCKKSTVFLSGHASAGGWSPHGRP